MRKIVFVQTPNGPLKVDDFIGTLAPTFQDHLRAMAEQLANSNNIEGPKVYRRDNNTWSVWLEDEKGDRHNFILYISVLDGTDVPPVQPTHKSRLRYGIYVSGDPRENEKDYWVEASDYIKIHFTGLAQVQLLEALRRAEKGLPNSDETLEWTKDGVILRALKDEYGGHKFQAELRLVRG